MREIELKILDVDVPKLKRQLKKLGAKCLGKVLVHHKSFDFEDGRIKKKGDLLRLRAFGKKVQLTYKIHRSSYNFKIAEEIETETKDFIIMEKILKQLGLKCVRDFEKYRTSYHLPGVAIELDEYPIIPPFIEIEGSQKTIRRTLKQLKINFKNTTTMSAGQVLRSYGINDKILAF